MSGLFQCCSLPENLWFRLEKRWKRTFSEPRISADFLWNSAEQLWFWTDSGWQSSVIFSIFFEIFRNASILSPNLRSNANNKNIVVQFSHGPKVRSPKVGFSVTAQITKLIWFNFSKPFSHLVGWTFKIIFWKIEFLLLFYRILRKVYFLWIRGMPF